MDCRKCKKALPEGAVYCPFCGVSVVPKPRPRKKRGNGQGSVYPLPNGKWKAVQVLGYYKGEDGKLKKKVVTRIFIRKSDAIAALPTLKSSEGRAKDMSLYDLYTLFTDSKEYNELSKSQRQKLTYAWNRWDKLSLRGIATLTVADIENEMEEQTTSYYPARDMKVILSHLYRLAIKKEIVTQNKSEVVEIPWDAPRAKRECWTEDEIKALWKDYESHPFTGYILIMCYAGLRYGELATVLLENIHLKERYMIGGIKTEAGINREIPISTKILPIIKELSKNKKTKLLEMGENQFYAAYWEMIERTKLRELPPHTCRHYFFSRMTAKGVQGGIIAEVGGHANYLTTLKNYVRIPLKDKLAAVNRI